MKQLASLLGALLLSGCAVMATDINDYDYSAWGNREAEARDCGNQVKRQHSFSKYSGFALQDFTRHVSSCMAFKGQQRQVVGEDWNNPRISKFSGENGRTTYQVTCNFTNEAACYRAASKTCNGNPYKIIEYEIWGNGIRNKKSGNNINIETNINIGYANKIYGASNKKPEYIRSTWHCE